MNNKSRNKISDRSDRAEKPKLKPLSDAEANQVVGGTIPWCRPPRSGGAN